MHEPNDLICLSHLRWNFVFQRPNHLMSQCAAERRVFFVEEPVFDAERAHTVMRSVAPNLFVVTPRLPPGLSPDAVAAAQRDSLVELVRSERIESPIVWFYTPMALEFARDVDAAVVVYDCMDELSGFHGAPARLPELERELFSRADVVFTGGESLFEAKRSVHPNVHLFPSSVDVAHYAEARARLIDPPDQKWLRRPRLGFFGVIDERMDLALLESVARSRPDWELVLVGPVVKIDPESLPRLPNLHYLGQKRYEELPHYLAGWQVALMPFAQNRATRFISPTKTLEYLAGGRPVVSTPIKDVVTPYGERGLVRVAEPADFVGAIEAALAEGLDGGKLAEVDAFLAGTSWESSWAQMSRLIGKALSARESQVA